MLLMGFNGLFTRLDAEFGQLLSSVTIMDFPEAWGKVDAIREARALQVNIGDYYGQALINARALQVNVGDVQALIH
jgi:hypothetical protein